MDIKNKFNEMSVLFPILTLYTLVYLGLMIYDFVAQAKFDMPSGMMAIYIALVGAYAADKEIRRWIGKAQESKMGSVFVYLWLVFFLVAFIIRSFKPVYLLPNDLSLVALQVLGVFFGSKASKKIYEMKKGTDPEVIASREDTIIFMIKKNGKITRKEVMAVFKISHNSAWKLLNGMESKKLIKQEGTMKGAHYVLLPS